MAVAFGVQAALLLGLGLQRGHLNPASAGAGMRTAGWLLAVAGLGLYPLARWLTGRPWTQAEVFGMAPEPTALASLGLLMISHGPQQHMRFFVLAAIPVLSLVLGAATLWTFQD